MNVRVEIPSDSSIHGLSNAIHLLNFKSFVFETPWETKFVDLSAVDNKNCPNTYENVKLINYQVWDITQKPLILAWHSI